MAQQRRTLSHAAAALLLATFVANAPAVELVVNGGFETNGGVGTAVFNGWHVFGFYGSWFAQSGTARPAGYACSNVSSVPPPPQGAVAAMTTQTTSGLRTLTQTVTIPPASTARFAAWVYVNNSAADFYTPGTLDPFNLANQQFRIDLIRPTTLLTDAGAGVLKNIYQTHVGDPLVSGYSLVTADLSEFAGQTVTIRIAEVENRACFSVGVDGVSIDASPRVATSIPAMNEYVLLATMGAVLGLGLVAVGRSS